MCGLAINIASFAHLLKRVDFNAIVDYLVLIHIIKSKAQSAMTRIKRLFELLHSYSFNLYYIKGKDLILSDFLSRQKHDDSNLHEIIPISFNMQGILQARFYNLGEGNVGKYLVQTHSQAKSSGIKLPEVHGVRKGLDSNIQPEKQVLMPTACTKMKEVSQIKPRIGQRRAGLKHKIKKPICRPIAQVIEKPVEKNKSLSAQNFYLLKIIPILNFAIPSTKSRDDPDRRVERKAIQDVAREISIYPDPLYRVPPKPVKIHTPEIPGSLLDIDLELNMDFKDNSTYQEGVISEMYQMPDKSYFQ